MFKNSYKNSKSCDKSTTAGFTLIEMIVSLGIFTLVAVVAIGAFLKIIDSNKKAQSLKTAVNNLNFALESMSREMRVGYGYYCGGENETITRSYTPGNCTEQHLMAFRSSKPGVGTVVRNCNLIYVYRYNSILKTVEKAEQSNCDQSIPSVGAPFIPLVSKELNVEELNFSAHIQKIGFGSKGGPGLSDALQAWVRIVVKASAGARATDKVEYMLNSFVSQRLMR